MSAIASLQTVGEMRSLRGRLGTLVGLGVFVLVLAAGFAIAVERWQEEKAGLAQQVTLAAFQLAESGQSDGVTVVVTGGREAVGMLLGNPPEVIASSGNVSQELEMIAVEELWPDVIDEDASVSVSVEGGSSVLHVSAVACVDADLCDTAVVAASEYRLGEYLFARSAWILGPAVALAALAVFVTRGLIGRSLQPVDSMRAELEMITGSDLHRRVPTPRSGDEIERLGEAMNDTLDRLGSAIAANQRFVADAAHELRSPITGVRAALELEFSRTTDGILEDGIRELDRASRLIDDLLVLARGEGSGGRHVEVDLDDVVNEQAALIEARFSQVSFERSISPARVIGDPDALRRLVGNMVENACLYGDGRVRIEVRVDGASALCTVDDNGPGIPVEERDRVFERFARLDASRARTTGGSGLGLAIVAEVARNHRGSVRILNSSLGGARFECRIPTYLGAAVVQ